MYLLKKILNKKGYCFTGRGGMFYFDGNNEYYIDTENYIPNEKSKSNYAVAILYKGIKFKNKKNEEIGEEKKRAVASEVQSLLEKDKIIATIV
mgnify:CR=1 FL=1